MIISEQIYENSLYICAYEIEQYRTLFVDAKV